MKKQKRFTITSVSYVHDPESAQKWFEAYIEIVEKELAKAIKKD
ncbi:hypothetical protein P4257_22535 [Bacillus thuringiensis]|nr:hypothetical protein [Bacillus thuringiensis]MED2812218.1 hypothetical protein [Bacillus thuringiensis]MED2829112.1 hypothetical protein [Bacillus thuringiensis]MED2831311.1 hypothetical protein [Bacillus thuringiensis]MED2858361.1 hypothetical protein [Bacillus thuringiensis]